jgi:hypothetical protein
MFFHGVFNKVTRTIQKRIKNNHDESQSWLDTRGQFSQIISAVNAAQQALRYGRQVLAVYLLGASTAVS